MENISPMNHDISVPRIIITPPYLTPSLTVRINKIIITTWCHFYNLQMFLICCVGNNMILICRFGIRTHKFICCRQEDVYEGNETGQENEIHTNGITGCPYGINGAKNYFQNNY
jgi:hypothetical protein